MVFFYESLLDEKYADKERNAVHSEWTLKGPNDWVILGQLDGLTLNNKHPISQFNWGNLVSLSDHNEQKLQTVLVDFYQQYYSANIMKASLISNLPLSEMKILASKYFGKIVNKNIAQPTIKAAAATDNELKKIVHYVPQTEMKQLQVKFVIDNNADEFAVKPNHYISYLLGNEMPGSLAATLRQLGLTENLWTSANSDEYGNSGSFTVYAMLTEEGLKQRDTIVGLIFNYIELIKDQGIDKKYFNEIKQSLKNSFEFKEKINDYSYAMQIAADLQKLPVNYVLSSDYEYQRFNAKAIEAVLEQLTLDNARVFYIDKAQPSDTDMTFFKGKYKVTAITDEIAQKWQQKSKNFVLSLPSANSLMPEKFSLVKAQYTEKPKVLLQEPGLSVYLAHSANFSQPKGSFTANFNTGFDKTSPRHQVMSDLLSSALNLTLTTLQSEAAGAGMGLRSGSYNGLYLTASGFTDKQAQLLASAYQEILAYKITSAELDNLKAAYISDLESQKKQAVISQLFTKFGKIVNLDSFSDQSLLAEVNTITTDEISSFKQSLLQRAKMNVFAFGNYTDKSVIKTARYLESLLPENRKFTEIYFSKTLKPKSGSLINWQQNVEMTDIALADLYMAPLDVKQFAAAKVLQQILRPALFNQLRTEEQLAYSVGFFSQAMREQMLLGFYIQSPAKGPAAIADRIDNFKGNFTKRLAKLSKEEFDTVRNSVLITLTQAPKNLREEARAFITDWRQNKLSFDSKAKLVAAIKALEFNDVVRLYSNITSSDDFGRVMVQMRGTKFKEEAFAQHDNAEQITDINAFHKAQLK